MQFHVVPKHHEVTQVLEEQIDDMSGTSFVPHDKLLRLIGKKIGHHLAIYLEASFVVRSKITACFVCSGV